MRIKGLFNQNQNDENHQIKPEDFDKLVRRLNTVEVHMNRLLKLEEKLHSFSKQPEVNHSSRISKNTDYAKMLQAYDKEISSIKEILLQVNQSIAGLNHTQASLASRQSHNYEKEIIHLQSKINMMEERNPIPSMTTDFINDLIQAKLDDYFKNFLDEKVTTLAMNLSLVNEIQLDLLKRVGALTDELTELRNQKSDKPGASQEEPVVVKEIHIDKLFLDKYEQNNNIAQIGIKELGGALNIGATYGTGIIPGELTEQMKQDMDELKKIKEETVGKQEEVQEETPVESSESGVEDGDFFTDIPIEGL